MYDLDVAKPIAPTHAANGLYGIQRAVHALALLTTISWRATVWIIHPPGHYYPLVRAANLQPNRIPIFGRLAALIFMFIMTLTVLVLSVARTQPVPVVFELPQAILRAGLPSAFGPCDSVHDGSFVCDLQVDGNHVSMLYDAVLQIGRYSAEPLRMLTLGDLIIAWGTPSGISHDDRGVTIFWGNHSAYFDPCSIQPGNHIRYLGYGQAKQPSSGWSGFVNLAQDCPHRPEP